jgi:hypothetical protein
MVYFKLIHFFSSRTIGIAFLILRNSSHTDWNCLSTDEADSELVITKHVGTWLDWSRLDRLALTDFKDLYAVKCAIRC